MKTVTAIIAGAAIQLAIRVEVRRELTNESTTPIRIAAGMPRNRTPAKMKTSPAVKLDFVLGMRSGFEPARIANPSNPAKPIHWTPERLEHCRAAHADTTVPAMTMATQ